MTRETQVLAAARAYGEQRLPGQKLELREFGIPSVGLDDSETHFVAIESEGTRLLVRVTLFPDGSVRVDPLTAA